MTGPLKYCFQSVKLKLPLAVSSLESKHFICLLDFPCDFLCLWLSHHHNNFEYYWMEYAYAKIVISFESKASCRISSDFDVVYAEILPYQNRLSLILFILEPCSFLVGYAGSCCCPVSFRGWSAIHSFCSSSMEKSCHCGCKTRTLKFWKLLPLLSLKNITINLTSGLDKMCFYSFWICKKRQSRDIWGRFSNCVW